MRRFVALSPPNNHEQNMIKLHRIIFFIFVGIAAALFSGCGNPRVIGHVQFDDGTPLTVGEVIFESATQQARGPIDKSGNYVMETIKKGDGVPPGNYRVYVGGAVEATGKQLLYYPGGEPIPTPTPRTYPEMRSLIDLKHTNPATSGLTCDVKGSTKFNITVSKPSADKK